jgi:hypothetical protein
MENHISENLWRNLIMCQLWHFVKKMMLTRENKLFLTESYF